MKTLDASAILLCGGYSSRMGSEKALLPFKGTDLIHHQVELLRGLGVGEILVSGYQKAPAGTRFVEDIHPHLGPLSGIHAGLLAMTGRAALILAVDTPLVPRNLLLELIHRHRVGEGITLVSHEGTIEPLIGVYDQDLSSSCEGLLRGTDHSLRSLFKSSRVSLLEYTGDPSLLMNCNTPEEYQLLLRLCREG